MSYQSMVLKKSKVTLSILNLALLILLIFIPLKANASESTTNVKDSANLLQNSQDEKLNSLLAKFSSKYNIDIVVLTINGLNGKSDKQYLEDYVDSVLDKGIYSENLVILQFDVDSRYCTIQAYGSCEQTIDDDNIEYILDVVAPQLSDHNYYGAFSDFAEGVSHYYNNRNYEFGQKPIYLKTWFQVIASFSIAGLVVGSMAYHSQGRNTVNNHTYLDEKNSGVVARRDIYLKTTLTKVKKPSNDTSSNSGRSSGGGGISSGGRSHSGGSRKC